MTTVRASRWIAMPVAPALVLGATAALALILASADAFAYARSAAGVRTTLEGAVYLATAAAAWNAARAFYPGDHLRRAWHLLALPPLLTTVAGLWLAGPGHPSLRWAEALLLVVANVCGVVAMLQFATIMRRAGLVMPGSAWQKGCAAVVLLAAALAAVGPDVIAMARLAAHGNLPAAAALVADVCDLALVVMIVPVFITARAFAGGSLSWPFAFLAACELTWLLFDGFQTYKQVLGMGPVAAEFVDTLLHRLAPLFVLAAAVAQRLALRLGAGDPASP